MAKSMKPAKLSRAGANSRPHHYKQKVQKMKDPSKTWVLTGKLFEDFRRKKNKNESLDLSKKPSGTDGSCTQLLNRDLVTRQNKLTKIEKYFQIVTFGSLEN